MPGQRSDSSSVSWTTALKEQLTKELGLTYRLVISNRPDLGEEVRQFGMGLPS